MSHKVARPFYPMITRSRAPASAFRCRSSPSSTATFNWVIQEFIWLLQKLLWGVAGSTMFFLNL